MNRLCGSGLDAVGEAARAIKAGDADLMIAGGVESMSRAPFVMGKAESAFARGAEIFDTTIGWRFVNPADEEEVRGRFHAGDRRERRPGLPSRAAPTRTPSPTGRRCAPRRRWTRAVFAREIVPVTIPQRRGDPKIVDTDEHPRPDTSLEALAKLRPLFGESSTVTAGNASGVNDGAAALIVASEAAVKKHGLTPRARVIAMATAGVPPRIMGVGPAPATEKLLEKTGRKIGDIDVIELNEAFASQSLAVLRRLGLPDDAEHVNPNGGAIALGHPLGMSGARLALTATEELQVRGARQAICTMCIGVGQGIAVLLEKA